MDVKGSGNPMIAVRARSTILLTLTLAAAGGTAFLAQTSPSASFADIAAVVERLVPPFLSNEGPSAASIAVVRKGEVLSGGGWG
jgi:hypothetical protein